jgi:hypothetical protein
MFEEKNLEVGRIVGLGFDGAATFLDEGLAFRHVYKGILLMLCHCHLACVQAANNTPGIAHVYRTLIQSKVKEHVRNHRCAFSMMFSMI